MDDPAAIVGGGPVLVLAPHPDDESLGCGALLASCWARGVPAHVLCLTDGAASHPGSAGWPAPRLAALRRSELEAAVACLGGDPTRDLGWLGHPDAALHRLHGPGHDLARDIRAAVQRTGARVLLAPSVHDPHCDHVAAARAAAEVADRLPRLRLVSYPVWSRWLGGGDAPVCDGAIRLRFDGTGTADRKRMAVAAHRSQAGAVIADDPGGFAMPEGFAEMFVDGPEIFDRMPEAATWG